MLGLVKVSLCKINLQIIKQIKISTVSISGKLLYGLPTTVIKFVGNFHSLPSKLL